MQCNATHTFLHTALLFCDRTLLSRDYSAFFVFLLLSLPSHHRLLQCLRGPYFCLIRPTDCFVRIRSPFVSRNHFSARCVVFDNVYCPHTMDCLCSSFTLNWPLNIIRNSSHNASFMRFAANHTKYLPTPPQPKPQKREKKGGLTR